MGLPERRSLKEFQDKLLPSLTAALQAAAGFPVEVEVLWDGLAKDDYAHLYAEAWPKVYFEPATLALKSITADDMGKAALKEKLKKIVFCNTNGNYYADGSCTFEGGVLKIDHDPVSNVDYVNDRRDFLVKILEKAL